MAFSYAELTTRNAGFLTPAEQATLRDAAVFVCGVGGMGGAAVQSLVRAGLGKLTIADMVAEVHDTHHPVGVGLYYADQKPEAARRAKEFRQSRVPKYLAWFENVLMRNPRGGAHLVGKRLSYADLSLFQLVDGLLYAFPKSTRRALKKTLLVAALHKSVAQHKQVAAYLASERRIAFNEDGIFRHYPELDA